MTKYVTCLSLLIAFNCSRIRNVLLMTTFIHSSILHHVFECHNRLKPNFFSFFFCFYHSKSINKNNFLNFLISCSRLSETILKIRFIKSKFRFGKKIWVTWKFDFLRIKTLISRGWFSRL